MKFLKEVAITGSVIIMLGYCLVLALLAITAVFGGIAYAIFVAAGTASNAAFWFGVIIGGAFAAAIKPSFIDSYITVRMVCAYMECVPQTEVSDATYDELSQKSSKFKKLNAKAQAEEQPA